MPNVMRLLLRFSWAGSSYADLSFRWFLCSLFVASAAASTVSGYILTFEPPNSGMAWQVHLVSDDNYAVDFSLPGDVLPESPPGCSPQMECGSAYPFSLGALATLVGTNCIPMMAGFCGVSATGSGVVDGVFYPSLVFDVFFAPPPTELVDTVLNFASAPFIVHSRPPAFYGVPFTLSGQIQAALPPISNDIAPTFLINDQVSGSGIVSFYLLPDSNGLYSLQPGVDWVFAPEPASALLVLGGLSFAFSTNWFVRSRRSQAKT